MFSMFVSGFCSATALHNIIKGDIGTAVLLITIAILNASLAFATKD